MSPCVVRDVIPFHASKGVALVVAGSEALLNGHGLVVKLLLSEEDGTGLAVVRVAAQGLVVESVINGLEGSVRVDGDEV